MSKKYHIEELRNMLKDFENDAQYLYRYGSISGSLDLFSQLNDDDKRRLIALALIEGSEDAKNVADVLMGKLEPRASDLEQLVGQMTPESQQEIELIRDGNQVISIPSMMIESDVIAIRDEIIEACNQFGHLEVEEAWWVLIPGSEDEEIDWIEAMGGEDDFYTKVSSTMEVGYHPGKDELNELISDMRKAKWILHIHNHPSGYCLPSHNDKRTAVYWKSLKPELAPKFKFFIIHAGFAIEYMNETGFYIRWL